MHSSIDPLRSESADHGDSSPPAGSDQPDQGRRDLLKIGFELLAAPVAVQIATVAHTLAEDPSAARVSGREPLLEPAKWSVNNRVIHVNNEPFFPAGIYYTSHLMKDKAQRLHDLDTIAAAGLNMVHTPIDLHDRPFLDKAADLGVYVAVEFNAEPEAILRKFSGHPAIAFLGTFDDVDQQLETGQQRYLPGEVARRSTKLKELAPNTLSYISAGYPNRSGSYRGKSDLFAQQSYPIPVEPLGSVTTSYLGPVAQLNDRHNQGFISNLQTFGWDGEHRQPTATELANMTYQSLILGTQGILYYTFFDSVTDLNRSPELLRELKTLTAELRDLAPYLLEGTHLPLSTQHAEVYAAGWRSEDNTQTLIIAVNSSDNPQNVSIRLPEALTTDTSFQKGVPGRAADLQLAHGSLSCEIKAKAVQVLLTD